MSSGPFVSSVYTDDDGTDRPIKVQPESITTWNPASTGTASGEIVRVSGGSRAYGRKARAVTLVRGIGPVTDGYQARATARIPVFTAASFNALSTGQSVDYNGETWQVSGFSKESGRFR